MSSMAASPWGSMRMMATSFLLVKSRFSQYSNGVGLSGSRRPDEEGMKDHVLLVDMIDHLERRNCATFNGKHPNGFIAPPPGISSGAGLGFSQSVRPTMVGNCRRKLGSGSSLSYFSCP